MRKIIKIPLFIIGVFVGLIVLALIALTIWSKQMESKAGYKEGWQKSDGIVIKDLTYGHKSSNTFDLYIPQAASKQQPQALMLFVHGGSWTSGDKKEMTYACRRFAKEGYFTATMNYTLIKPHSEVASISSMLDEILSCISKIKEYTLKKGYNIERMSISGTSAGGHLAMLFALKKAKQSPIPITFITERVGPTNLTKIFNIPKSTIDSIANDIKQGKTNDKKSEIDNLVYVLTGKTITSTQYSKSTIDSLLLAFSPISYVDSCSVPAIFAYGEQDFLIKTIHAHEIDSLYQAYNIPHKLILFPHSNHFLADDPECSQQFTNETKNYCRKYFGY